MSGEGATGATGSTAVFRPFEVRHVVLAIGAQFHEDELTVELSDFQFLEDRLGSDFEVSSDRRSAVYIAEQQRVEYRLKVVHRKDEFKHALETPGRIVIYGGHSRYGRGACFGDYTGSVAESGEHWGDGVNNRDGIYRLAFPYVPVSLSDIEHHGYRFAPYKVEDNLPTRSGRHPFPTHPHGRRSWRRIELPASLRGHVAAGYTSPSNTYWGVRRRGETSLILHAGWDCNNVGILDLGGTEMRCTTFCHFGCSSRLHFWDIVRRPQYKGWVRPASRETRYAYFTTAPSDSRAYYWIYYVLAYPRENAYEPFWRNHQYAKHRANRRLRAIRAGFSIY